VIKAPETTPETTPEPTPEKMPEKTPDKNAEKNSPAANYEEEASRKSINPSASPQPDDTPKPFVDITDAELRDVVAQSGTGNVSIGKIIQNLRPGIESPPTLFDYLEELPRPHGVLPPFSEPELCAALRTLAEERLLLIVCSDRELLRGAGDAFLAHLKTSNQRVLTFNGLPSNMTADIHGLTKRSAKSELVVMVDAHEGDRAQLFVDSLFPSGVFGKQAICLGLGKARVRVACLTSEENLAGRTSRLEFGHWLISTANILLRQHDPETSVALETRIAEQRKAGNWSRSPVEFRKQLEELIRSGELQSVVDRGGPLAALTIDAPNEQGPIADPENALAIAVLYAATYYPNLPAGEFIRIVELIVGDQHMLVQETIKQKTKEGSLKTVQLQRDRRLIDLWTERTDATLRECHLVTNRDVGRAITFADVGRRDLLRRHFEEQYGAYVQRQFLLAWDTGLLFEKSSRVAADVVLLTLDMTASDPYQFDRDWLSDRIVHFCDRADNLSFVLRRVSDLLRAMLRNPPLDSLVGGVVERLLQLGRHAYALAIVKALRRAPEFDDLYWIQQILDRGTDEVRSDVLSYLFNELRRADSSIHRYVAALEEKWLPAEDRDPGKYSQSNCAALLTLFAYCFEVTDGFDDDLYGAWPSRFPILAIDRPFAAKQFMSVLRCLLHPGLIHVLGEAWEPEALTREVATLISKWVFILYGVSDRPAGADDDAAGFTRDIALSVLVEQILEVTKNGERRTLREWMVDEWEWAKQVYLRAPSRLGEEGHQRRHEFGAKRRLMDRLISEFRRLQRARHEPTPARAAMTERAVTGIHIVRLQAREEQP